MKYLLFIPLILWANALWANLLIERIQAYSLKTKSNQTILFNQGQMPSVVLFLSKDCPCSKGNIDYINELSRQFPNFRFLGIHSKKKTPYDEIAAYLNDTKLDFEVYADNDLSIADQFKALKTPHIFILNPQGEVIYNGGITNSTFPKNAKEFYLKEALVDIQNHKLPSHAETKTLGCFIVR